jgi:hypothetical protein
LCWQKSFEEALNAVKFLGLLKKIGLAQNILGPVKGQGICFISKLENRVGLNKTEKPFCLIGCIEYDKIDRLPKGQLFSE